jgi:hypothetical protein
VLHNSEMVSCKWVSRKRQRHINVTSAHLLTAYLLTGFFASAHAGTISSVSGTVSDGNTITVSGSGFGTKPTGAPWKWDALDGANGDRLEPRGWLVHQNTPQALLSNERLRPTSGAATTMRFANSGGSNQPVPWVGFGNNDGGYLDLTSASAVNYRPFPSPAYIDYWMYFHPPAAATNYKFYRHHANISSGQPDGYWGMPGSASPVPCSNFDWSSMNGGLPQVPGAPDLGCPTIAEKWVHVQILFEVNNRFVQYVDGIKYVDVSNFGYTTRANFGFEHQVLESTNDSRMYLDDIYIDASFSRVELGNAPTYDASTHREVQIPQSWANGSISLTVNRGTFASGSTAYLYVVDSNNLANTQGFPVVIGGGSPPPPAGSACDLNSDSATNVSDVQLCANQAIGVTTCATGDINHDSNCNVVDVQRVVNAALGGQCVTQ